MALPLVTRAVSAAEDASDCPVRMRSAASSTSLRRPASSASAAAVPDFASAKSLCCFSSCDTRWERTLSKV